MYSALVLFVLAGGAAATAYLLLIIRKLFRSYNLTEITQEWLENFSVAHYAPMERLLAADDFEFLSRQPGFDLSLYSKLRRERLQIFRQYLDCLISDFGKLHSAVLAALPLSQTDHSELVGKLIRLKLLFCLYVLRVECGYVLCLCGSRTISVGSLIQSLEKMNSHHLQISAAQAI